ncbi:hypothetical protein A9Q84_20930 [Halobacteriovorax marinus]|uniref:Uncharacterized protein n=1 Tax=Halobacteriovorax marinus TaxID=97084 RepID=A0A1Y5F1S7_9BACT|nr:hypothetical protein A9Q84_20930 [Halobacteriovorax marinus]
MGTINKRFSFVNSSLMLLFLKIVVRVITISKDRIIRRDALRFGTELVRNCFGKSLSKLFSRNLTNKAQAINKILRPDVKIINN